MTATILMGIVAAGLGVAAYLKGGDAHIAGLRAGAKMFVDILPLLFLAFAVAGFIQVLIPRELITRWLGKEAGFKGLLIASVAGGLTPGGPFVSFPIIAAIYKNGASIGTVVAFVTAWSLWAVSRLPMEVGYIGPRPALVRFLSTLIFPPVAGWIADNVVGKWI